MPYDLDGNWVSDSEDTSGEQEAQTQTAWERASQEAQDANEADQAAHDARTAELLRQFDSSTSTGFGGVGTDASVGSPNFTEAEKEELSTATQSIPSKMLDSITSRYTTNGVTDWMKVGRDVLTAGAAYKAYQQAAAPTPKTGYQGGIPSYRAVRSQVEPTGIAAARPGAGGQRYFTDTQYTTASGLPAAQAADTAQKATLQAQNLARQQAQMAQAPTALTPEQQQAASDKFYGRTSPPPANRRDVALSPEQRATVVSMANQQGGAQGIAPEQALYNYAQTQGLSNTNIDTMMGLPTGATQNWLGANPQQQTVQAAQGGLMGLAHGGSTTKPGGTYLQGSTDGMADKIHATIDGKQPARLAHGEFVVPADVVSHLGNGNSDAGAKQLYKMMDKIRQARTGNKKQGRQIDPAKFTPGGIAGYAAGGTVQHFEAGGATGAASGVTGTESNLSNWAGPYVTDMMGKGQALSEQPYQAYGGPLTAGESALQTQAFGNAANLATPASIGQAADTAGAVGTKMGNLSYAADTAKNQFTAPGAYTGTTATNQFNAPAAYETGNFTTGTFGTEQAQQYMNPYLQASLDPQLAEARRQSEVSRIQQAGQMTRSGAFGGSRQAISEAEGYRNLGTNLANITGQGYNTAFGQAQTQFNTEQARQAAVQQATEQSRQFGAGQSMTAAQQAAQYGQAAQAQNEQSKQFGASQGLSAAQSTAQYGQAAQAQTEQAKQFGATYGLQALQGQLSAAQAQGQLGGLQAQTGLANLQAQLGAGATQRGIAQEGVAADKTAFEAERDNPYKMVQFQQSLLQGLPLQAQSYNITNNPYTAAAGAASTINTALGGGPAPKFDAQTGKPIP